MCVCIVVYSVYCVLEYVSLCTSGLAVSQLILSSRTVWVRCVNGDLARRYGVSDRNPAGDYWKKIPGNANWLTGETGVILVRLGVCDCYYCLKHKEEICTMVKLCTECLFLLCRLSQ